MARELPDPNGKSKIRDLILDSNFTIEQEPEEIVNTYAILFNDNREPLIITATMGSWAQSENQLIFYAKSNKQDPIAIFKLDNILGFSLVHEEVESSKPLGLELNPPRLALPAPQY